MDQNVGSWILHLTERINYDLPDLQLMVLLQFKRKWLTWVYYLGGTWSLLVSFFFHLTRVTIVIFRAAWRLWERMARTFWPCAHEISQNQLDVSGAVSIRKSLLLNLFVFTVSCCYLLFIHFTFVKNQYTIVENKGASSVKLSSKLDLDMRTKFF